MKGYLASASEDFEAPGDWGKYAQCYGKVNMEDQVPSGNGFKPNLAAVTTCNGCEVKTECLSWAMSHGSDPTPGMVVGGLYSFERRRLRQG